MCSKPRAKPGQKWLHVIFRSDSYKFEVDKNDKCTYITFVFVILVDFMCFYCFRNKSKKVPRVFVLFTY